MFIFNYFSFMIMFQVLRFVMLMTRQRQKVSYKPAGGLLVLVWTETEASAQRLNCTGMEAWIFLFPGCHSDFFFFLMFLFVYVCLFVFVVVVLYRLVSQHVMLEF